MNFGNQIKQQVLWSHKTYRTLAFDKRRLVSGTVAWKMFTLRVVIP